MSDDNPLASEPAPEPAPRRAPAKIRAPHNIHAIGIGRTGAAYIEALIRTGEVEDLLATPGTRFAALLIDIGDDDILVPGDYARSLKTRLKSRGIATDGFHYESLALAVPDKAALGKLPKLPKGTPLPQAGGHVPRAIAKAIFALNAEASEGALQRFADHVKGSDVPSTVFLAYGLAGGTGSGIAVDLAQLLKGKLPASAQVVGVGQLAHSGDGEYFNSAAQYQAIDAVDAALQSSTNPFGGGFFVVASEQSWQRLSAYTSTGLKEVRQRFKQMVTNRFVADSFMRFAMSDGSEHLLRALQPGRGKCTLFDVAKLTHPGVQVLPGEAGSKWDAVLQQWIGFVPKYSGLRDGFRTDYAEVHVHASHDMRTDMIDAALKDVIASHYLNGGTGGKASCLSFHNEFFDVLTAYGNVILPGALKDDFEAYPASKASFDKLDAAERLLEQV
jgi:hypothetical protein